MVPLSKVSDGKKVQLVSVHGGRGLVARLAAMGMIPGVELEVIRGSTHGPVVVAVKQSRLALGRGMAHKVMVK